MSRRKDELRALFGGEAPPQNAGVTPQGEARPETGRNADAPEAVRSGSGAVRAMGLQLGAMKAGAEEARALRDSVARGERVVEVNPSRIDPAFLADRLSVGDAGDESFASLKAAIARDGQQVPVLLRPHPDAARAAEGHYQSAYGHRRIQAARELGLPVRALVRSLSDEELVLAQGQENSERRDLSFVERAFFARAMLQRGFERAVAQAALGVEKAEMTRLLQVADAVPDFVARAVGPAPKAGRGRWMELAGHLQSVRGEERAHALVLTEGFRALASDARFSELMRLFARRGDMAKDLAVLPTSVSGANGAAIATLKRSSRGVALTLPDDDFAVYLARRMPDLHERFLAEKGEDSPRGDANQ